MTMKCVIAGKNELAVHALGLALEQFSNDEVAVIPSRLSVAEQKEGPSLAEAAQRSNVRAISLEASFELKDVIFLSLEFDRILDTKRFRSPNLYNLHLSLLPNFRGVATSFWPIFLESPGSGVSLHRVDQGIDTGPIVAQSAFEIGQGWTAWDLYKALIYHGSNLLDQSFLHLTEGTIKPYPQAPGGSFFSRGSFDFANTALDAHRDWRSFDRHFRALYFPKFQRPSYFGRPLAWRTLLEDSYSGPTGFRFTSKNSGVLRLSDSVIGLDFLEDEQPRSDLF